MLAYEYSNDCFQKHSPQAYAVQHPPRVEIQRTLFIDEKSFAASRQSVAIHLFALYLIIEKDMPLAEVFAAMRQLLDTGIKLEDEQLDPPEDLGNIIIAHVLKARTPKEHWQIIEEWNRSA